MNQFQVFSLEFHIEEFWDFGNIHIGANQCHVDDNMSQSG